MDATTSRAILGYRRVNVSTATCPLMDITQPTAQNTTMLNRALLISKAPRIGEFRTRLIKTSITTRNIIIIEEAMAIIEKYRLKGYITFSSDIPNLSMLFFALVCSTLNFLR